ncbi:MAG: hypothetical protein ACFFAE_18915 [Candidatus Hodarchaeota archaeon]
MKFYRISELSIQQKLYDPIKSNVIMLKLSRHRLLSMISFILLLLLPFLYHSAASSAYSKIWTQSDGSKLEITISSYSTNLLVDTTYTYKIILKANAFGSNLDGYYSIAVGIRFICSEETIKSDLKCDIADLVSVGSKVHALIELTIPSAAKFSLNRGESVQGQLQYIVYYSEQLLDWDKSEMAPYQWPHESDISLGWETISQGKITNPFFNLLEFVIIALITVSLISSVIVIYTIVRRRA